MMSWESCSVAIKGEFKGACINLGSRFCPCLEHIRISE